MLAWTSPCATPSAVIRTNLPVPCTNTASQSRQRKTRLKNCGLMEFHSKAARLLTFTGNPKCLEEDRIAYLRVAEDFAIGHNLNKRRWIGRIAKVPHAVGRALEPSNYPLFKS